MLVLTGVDVEVLMLVIMMTDTVTECCFIHRLSCDDKYLGIVAFKDVVKNCFGVVIEWRGDVAFR